MAFFDSNIDGAFPKALFGIGAMLVAIGMVAAILNSGASAEGGLLESIASGVASTFLALFSGVMIGVGATIAIDSMVVSLHGSQIRAAVAFLLCILSALISVSAIAGTQSSFWRLILFFAGLSSAGTFLLTGIAFTLSGAAKKYLSDSRD